MTSLPILANLRLKSLMMRKKKDEHQQNLVENLLKPIGSLEPPEGDRDDSDISEISDVFEEFHKNSYLRPQSKRYLTKHEADIRTMADFTDDFKRTISIIREDLNIGEDLLLENVDGTKEEKSNDSQIFPTVVINRQVAEKLEDTAYSVPLLSDLRDMRKASETSTTSIVWQMLEANREKEKFEISPPDFNTFKQTQPHWLQRPSVSWSDIDRAKLKCENWLEQHCN